MGIGCCSFLAQLLLNRGFQIQVAAKSAAVNYTQVRCCVVLMPRAAMPQTLHGPEHDCSVVCMHAVLAG